MDHLCLVFLMLYWSVLCCLLVICWERVDLVALVGDVNCIFVTFPCGFLGQVWYLIVSFPDPCGLSYFYNVSPRNGSCRFPSLKFSYSKFRLYNGLQQYLHYFRLYT